MLSAIVYPDSIATLSNVETLICIVRFSKPVQGKVAWYIFMPHDATVPQIVHYVRETFKPDSVAWQSSMFVDVVGENDPFLLFPPEFAE